MDSEPDRLWKTTRNQMWDVWIWLEFRRIPRIIMGFPGFYPSAKELCCLLTDHFDLSTTVVHPYHSTTEVLHDSELLKASHHYIVKGITKNWEVECQDFVFFYNHPLRIDPYPDISRGDGRYYIVHPRVARMAYLYHGPGWKDDELYQSDDNSISLDSTEADELQKYQLFFRRPLARIFKEIDGKKSLFIQHHVKFALWTHCIGDPGPQIDEETEAYAQELRIHLEKLAQLPMSEVT
ncbi:hypothetical protein DL96DRAFT_321427 [Flagelloscypha sp. PMI_526]|nr:hypothetical protein DL96DRAFT_321427 [Flagelloscypha sp. PMI_526]